MGFFEKLKNGLKKTKDSMMGRIEGLLHSFSKIDEDLFEELEETLILCDIGVTTSEKICDKLRQKVKQEGVKEPEKIKDIIIENRYSRIPVYEGTVDHVVGILHTRDYLERLADGKAPDVKELMQPPYFVFKTQQLSKILNAFKRTKIHLAVVTDEYGGTLGIVTMEDLLEEIVGEIWDEDEEIEHNYYKIGKGEFLVNGDMELEDMLGLFDMDEDSLECDSVTVGGYILEHAGTIPHKRDNIEADGFKFTIMEVKDQRILRVVVKKNDTSEENESDEKSENKKSE